MNPGIQNDQPQSNSADTLRHDALPGSAPRKTITFLIGHGTPQRWLVTRIEFQILGEQSDKRHVLTPGGDVWIDPISRDFTWRFFPQDCGNTRRTNLPAFMDALRWATMAVGLVPLEKVKEWPSKAGAPASVQAHVESRVGDAEFGNARKRLRMIWLSKDQVVVDGTKCFAPWWAVSKAFAKQRKWTKANSHRRVWYLESEHLLPNPGWAGLDAVEKFATALLERDWQEAQHLT